VAAVANAGPLIALAKIDHFSLLHELFRIVIVPQAVWEEVVVKGAGRPGAELAISAHQDGWLQQLSVQDTLAVTMLRATLGPGESEAIVLAQQLKPEWMLLDDDLARAHALRLGLRVTGTAAILLAASQAGLVADLKATLDELRTRGFWLRERVYQAVLTKAAAK